MTSSVLIQVVTAVVVGMIATILFVAIGAFMWACHEAWYAIYKRQAAPPDWQDKLRDEMMHPRGAITHLPPSITHPPERQAEIGWFEKPVGRLDIRQDKE